MSDPYYRMFPREWDDGTAQLSLEAEAALLRICNAINSRGKPLPDDEQGDREMMHRCRVSMRKWRALKSELVHAGKITVRDGIIDALIVKAMKRAAGRVPLPEKVRRAVFERDGELCIYCGDADGPFEIDHVHPVSRGGSDDLENLVVACRACNRDKGALTLSEWGGS